MASAAAAVLRWGLRLALPDTASDVQLYDGGEEEEEEDAPYVGWQ